jgi:type IX secretion system PorP/SprF family membrane protein
MKKLFSIIGILGLTLQAFAQMGARIDQFYMDPSISVPAAITSNDQGSVSLYYNKIFNQTPGSPQHTLFNIAMPVKNKNTAFGILYLKESIAFSEIHNAYATYAYSLGLGSTKLSLGVSAGVLSQNFDASKMVYIHENDPKINAISYSAPVVRADLRASIFAKADKWYAGFSVSRLPKPHFDYTYYNYSAGYDLQTQSTLLLGFKGDLGSDLTIRPAVNCTWYNWDYLYLQANVSFWYKDKVWVGLGENNFLQFGGNIGFKPQDDISVSYSYTVPNGEQSGLLGPIHEFRTTIGFAALGGGSVSSKDDGSDNTSSEGGDEESNKERAPKGRERLEVTARSLKDMKTFGKGHDTTGIHLPPIDKIKPEVGFYLVAGLHSNEDKANKQIKELYMKDVIAFKFFEPKTKSYYVYMEYYFSEKEANKGIFYYESTVPQMWVKEVK